MASEADEKVPPAPVKGRETSEFLMMIVRTLSTSADLSQREKEKARIEKSFRESDKKLVDLVTANYQDLTKITSSFGNISKQIHESREKIRKIKDDLSSCKTLLHCKRDELRRLWIEGVEHKTMVSLLDQIELIKEVPTKLDNFLLKKHYLHATNMLVNAVAKLDGPLAGIAALKDLRSELQHRRETMHELLIEELNRLIYVTIPSAQKVTKRSDSLGRPGDYSSLDRKKGGGVGGAGDMGTMGSFEAVDLYKDLKEDVNSKPEDNPPHFIAILVESLSTLKKVPEAAEGLKAKIQPELCAIVSRASQQVLDSTSQQGELMSNQNQPRFLLELLEIVFQQFRLVASTHQLVLKNLIHAVISGVLIRGDQMYEMTDVWSKIQAVIELLLREYLDVRNSSVSNQGLAGGFDEPNTDINHFFQKKRQAKPKKTILFRFDASFHAISTNSYVEDSRAFDSSDIFGTTLLAELGLEKHQMVCKPSVYNITAIFCPLQSFIKEIEDAIACQNGTSSLQSFVTDFVKNIFLGQVHHTVSSSIAIATKVEILSVQEEDDDNFDTLRHVIDHKTQRDLGLNKPLLTSTYTVDKNIMELRALMHDLPDYADQFLNMICKILKEYRDTSHLAYKSIVQYDSDEKRVISATWARDEDISRFLRSLPSWLILQPSDKQNLDSNLCSEEELKILKSKEVDILIRNLSSSSSMIPQMEIITDISQMRTIANMHESLEWFAGRLRQFYHCLSARSESTHKYLVELGEEEYPPVSDVALGSLKALVKDFQDLSEICLLLLHLEVRVHCFYFLLPVARQSNYAGAIDDLDPDSRVLKLNKNLVYMEEVLNQSLQRAKFRYIFDNLGFLVASILMNGIQYVKKINENGVKKMCRNLFAIQQNLTNITQSRETDLDHARQFYELLYLNPDDLLTTIAEKGAQFTWQEYQQLIELHHKSHPSSTANQLEQRLQRLKELLNKSTNGSHS